MSDGANPFDLESRVAYFVDKIFKGIKPADLPIEQPTETRRMWLTRADKVIR